MTTLVVVILVLIAILALNITLTGWRNGQPQERVEDNTGLPAGVVVYSDADGAGAPLFSTRYPLLGKPDYIVLTPDGMHIPVDVKSGRTGRGPRHEDVLQVVVYLMILDDLYPHDPAPRWGELRYANAAFEVVDEPALRDEVLTIVADMQEIDALVDDGGLQPPVGVAPPYRLPYLRLQSHMRGRRDDAARRPGCDSETMTASVGTPQRRTNRPGSVENPLARKLSATRVRAQ